MLAKIFPTKVTNLRRLDALMKVKQMNKNLDNHTTPLYNPVDSARVGRLKWQHPPYDQTENVTTRIMNCSIGETLKCHPVAV